MLEHFQLSGLVDAIVLSYEVGYLKPSPEVYQAALEQLAAEPECAVFVDDQESYCAVAEALGIRAIRVDRQGRRRGTAVTGLKDLVQVVDFETA